MIRKILQEKSLALIIWTSFLISAGFLLFKYHFWYLHILPIPTLLYFFLIIPGSAFLAFKGFIKTLIFKERLKTIGWTLTGILPIIFSILVFKQNEFISENPAASPGPLSKNLFLSLSESYLNYERLIYYPFYFEGDKVVMFTNWKDWNEGAKQNVNKADDFIHQIEERLNRKCQNKAYWVRNQLQDVDDYRSYMGLVPATSPKNLIESSDFELETEDRYNLASFVIESILGPNSNPPALIIEGWRRIHHPDVDFWYEQLAWQRRKGLTLSLPELASITCFDPYGYLYSCFNIETTGPVFCDYLLKKYSVDQFLELYSTCSAETFQEDFQRIYQISLQDFEKKFWEDFDKKVSSREHLRKFHYLYQADIAEGIDREQLYHIFDQHIKAHWNSLRSYDGTKLTLNKTEYPDFGNRSEKVETILSGDHLKLFINKENTDFYSQNFIISPVESFLVYKSTDNKFWQNEISEITNHPEQNELLRTQLLSEIHKIQEYYDTNPESYLYLENTGISEHYRNPEETYPLRDWKITDFEKIQADQNTYWTITGTYRDSNPSKLTLTIDPQNNWAVREYSLERDLTEFKRTYSVTSEFKKNQDNRIKKITTTEKTILIYKNGLKPEEKITNKYDYSVEPYTFNEDDFLISSYPVSTEEPEEEDWLEAGWSEEDSDIPFGRYANTYTFLSVYTLGITCLILSTILNNKIKSEKTVNSSEGLKQHRNVKRKYFLESIVIILIVAGISFGMPHYLRRNTWDKIHDNSDEMFEIEYDPRYPKVNDFVQTHLDYGPVPEFVETITGNRYWGVSIFDANDYKLSQLPASNEITYCSIDGMKISPQGYNFLNKFPEIEILDAYNFDDCENLLKNCSSLQRLIHIHLSHCHLTESALKRLLEIPNLTTLTLEVCYFSENALSILSQQKKLEGLSFSQTDISDDELKILSEIKVLESLNLPSSKITDEGLLFLKNHPTLKRLKLSYTKITDKSIPVILSLKKLTDLEILYSHISPEGIIKLQERFPELE